MKSIKVSAAAIGSLIIIGSLGLASQSFAEDKPGMEKCYGVAKASMNDYAANGHSCAGQAKSDSNGSEWLQVPDGTCERLVGGSLTPKK